MKKPHIWLPAEPPVWKIEVVSLNDVAREALRYMRDHTMSEAQRKRAADALEKMGDRI